MSEAEANEVDEARGGVEPGELGRMLRSAREARDLSVEDLAHLLRLEPKIVRALESEDFDHLPPPAFVRGYLRAIAKEHGMDSAAFLAVFEQRAGNEEPELADFKSRAPLQITSESNLVRYTTVTLVLLLVVLIALWWRAQDHGALDLDALVEQPGPSESETTPEPEPAEPLPYEFPVVTHPQAPFAGGEPMAPGAAMTPGIVPPPDAVDEPGAAMVPPAAATPEPIADEAVAPAAAITAVDTGGETGADGAAAAPADASADATGELVIRTREEAWIDVSDASGRRLFFDIARPGRELELGGTPPYKLVIGNSPSVSVSFRGAEVDLAPHANEGVARLELGR